MLVYLVFFVLPAVIGLPQSYFNDTSISNYNEASVQTDSSNRRLLSSENNDDIITSEPEYPEVAQSFFEPVYKLSKLAAKSFLPPLNFSGHAVDNDELDSTINEEIPLPPTPLTELTSTQGTQQEEVQPTNSLTDNEVHEENLVSASKFLLGTEKQELSDVQTAEVAARLPSEVPNQSLAVPGNSPSASYEQHPVAAADISYLDNRGSFDREFSLIPAMPVSSETFMQSSLVKDYLHSKYQHPLAVPTASSGSYLPPANPSPKGTQPSHEYLPPSTHAPPTTYIPPSPDTPPPTYIPPSPDTPPPTYIPPSSDTPSPTYIPPETYLPPTTYLPPSNDVPPTAYIPSPTYIPPSSYIPPSTYIPPTENTPSSKSAYLPPSNKYVPPADTSSQIQLSKFFFTGSGPQEEKRTTHLYRTIPIKRIYKIIFINNPVTKLPIAQPQEEEKTVIYVLNNEPLIEVKTKEAPSKPEVFFVSYKTPQEAEYAQREIQAKYDTLGKSYIAEAPDGAGELVLNMTDQSGTTEPAELANQYLPAEETSDI